MNILGGIWSFLKNLFVGNSAIKNLAVITAVSEAIKRDPRLKGGILYACAEVLDLPNTEKNLSVGAVTDKLKSSVNSDPTLIAAQKVLLCAMMDDMQSQIISQAVSAKVPNSDVVKNYIKLVTLVRDTAMES